MSGNLSHSICDLYSTVLLSKSMGPVFHNHYNVEFRDGFFMPVHSHEYIEIMYVRKGSCEIEARDERYRMEAGDFILLNSFVPHKLSVDRNTPCKVLCLEFDFACSSGAKPVLSNVYGQVKEVRFFLSAKKDVVRLKDTVELYTVLGEICRELDRDEPGKSIFIQASFAQMIIRLARLFVENEHVKRSHADMYIRDAIAYMNCSYHEEIGVEQVAGHVNLNVSYFHKIFKQVTGQTPGDFLNNIRISKAKSLLEKSDIPIIEICNFVGFNSRQYFTYIFKKQTGLSPGEYRRNHADRRKPASANNHCYNYIADP